MELQRLEPIASDIMAGLRWDHAFAMKCSVVRRHGPCNQGVSARLLRRSPCVAEAYDTSHCGGAFQHFWQSVYEGSRSRCRSSQIPRMVGITAVCQKSFLFGLLAVYLMSGAKGLGRWTSQLTNAVDVDVLNASSIRNALLLPRHDLE